VENILWILKTYYFHERVLGLGYVTEGFLERYRTFVNTVDIHVHARIRLLLMHQDNQTLQRSVHREAVYGDVRGAASTSIVETLEYNWTIEIVNIIVTQRFRNRDPENLLTHRVSSVDRVGAPFSFSCHDISRTARSRTNCRSASSCLLCSWITR